MSELALAVVIRADGSQLVNQLSAAQVEALGLKQSMQGAATGADQFKQSASAAKEEAKRLADEQRKAAAEAKRLAAEQRKAAAEEKAAAQALLSAHNQRRQAYQQIGYQAQDFFVQVQAGQGALRAFAQQGGQMAQALQILANSTDATKGKMAGFARFLGGPWGIAIGVAIPLIGILAEKLLSNADASDSAQASTIDFTDALAVRMAFVTNFTGAIDQLNDATRGLINTQALLIDTTRASAQSAVAELEASSARVQGQLSAVNSRINGRSFLGSIFGFQRAEDDLQSGLLQRQADTIGRQLASARQALAQATTAYEERAAVEGRDRFAGRRGALQRQRAELLAQRRATLSGQVDPLAGNGTAISESEFQRQLQRIDGALDKVQSDERASNRRPRSNRSAEAAARRRAAELERVRDQGLRAADAIARINDRWSAQPTLIQQANEATRDLNTIIRQAQERLAKGGLGAREVAQLNGTIHDAQAALANVQSGLARPFNEMVAAAGRQRDVQLLIVQGREREAEILKRTHDLEERGVQVTDARAATIAAIVDQEERINDLLAARDAVIGAYKSSIGDLRSSLEDLFSGGNIADFARNLTKNVNRLRGQLLTEQLFGAGLRNIEQQIRRETGLEGAVQALDQQTRGAADTMAVAGDAIARLGDAASSAAGAIGGSAPLDLSGNGFSGQLQTVIDDWFTRNAAALNGGVEPDIVVTARRQSERSSVPTLTTMRQSDYFREIAHVLASPLLDQLRRIDDTMGTRLAGRLGGVIEGGIQGYLTAGPVGGVIGALRGIGGLPDSIDRMLGKAAKGAETGQLVSQGLGALGIKTSSTGSSLGGALGGMAGSAFGPAGELIGSIAGSVFGGIIGGLFKKAPRASTTLTSVSQDISVSGNNADAKAAVSGVAGGVQTVLQRIADALGGTTGAFGVSIGQRNDYYRVSGSAGADVTSKHAGNLLYDGQDANEAVRIAALNAIGDGAIEGVSAAVKRALASSTDIDKALKEALKVQQVEDIIGGIGSTLERQFRAFEAQAKERVRIATQYGFDVVKIEERNAEDRKKLLDQLIADRTGPLQQLLKDVAYGNLFEGSAADRRNALIAEVAKARADAEAGVDGAAQKLADLSRELVQTSRDAFGTAGAEFSTDRANAISAAENVIALENDRIKAAQDAAMATKDAVQQSNVLLGEANDQLARIAAILSSGGNGGGSGISVNQAMVVRQVSV